MESSQPFVVTQRLQERSKQALTTAHYLASIIDPWVEIYKIARSMQD